MIKKFLPRSLMGRSLLILIIPVIVVQLTTGYIFINRHWEKVVERLSEAVAGDVALLVHQSEFVANSRVDFQLLSQMAISNLDIDLEYLEGSYTDQYRFEQFTGWEKYVADIFIPVLGSRIDQDFVLNLDFHDKWVFVFVQLDHGVLKFSFPARRLFSSSGYIFLLWTLGVSILLLLIAVLFMRNQIRPIRKLAAAAERFGKGHDISSFRVSGSREVRQAGRAFLEMAARIKRQIEQRTLMLAGVSHDLRTPLTRLKLAISMINGEKDDVEHIQNDLRQMETMIDGYLSFVRDGNLQEDVSQIDCSYFENIARRYLSCEFQDLSPNDRWVFSLKASSIERCLINILDNAQRFGKKMLFSVLCDDQGLKIIIEDDGPGISEQHMDDVFRPFFQVESAREIGRGHTGLGLAIVADIIHDHGGQVHMERSELGGAKVVLFLPC